MDRRMPVLVQVTSSHATQYILPNKIFKENFKARTMQHVSSLLEGHAPSWPSRLELLDDLELAQNHRGVGASHLCFHFDNLT